jgi:Ca-activated chloride channel family protein
MVEHNGSNSGAASAGAGLAIEARWEKALVPAGGGAATLLIRFASPAQPPAGGRRAPLDVAFALDRSGSMSGEKLALVKEAVDVAVRLLREEDRVALVAYDNRVSLVQPLAAASTRTKTALRLALHGLDAGGSTALADGWLTACRELAEAPALADGGIGAGVRIRRALLLTDGLANVGETDPAALAEHAHELRRRGVGTTTLGVGVEFDEDLLAGLAEAGGGNFQWIGRAAELRAFFEREIGELLSIAASDLNVTLTLPDGVRGTVFSAYPHQMEGRRLTVALGDLPAGEEVPLLVSLQAEPGALDAVLSIAIEATWADPAADSRRQAIVEVAPLRYAQPTAIDATTPDPQVQEQAALQNAAAAQREAVRLDRAGRFAESRRVLRASTALLSAAPATARVTAYARMHAQFADADESAPLSEEARKQATWAAHRTARGRRQEP